MKKLILVALLATISLSSISQIRIMSYNLLNFPTGNLAGRVDTLSNIIDYYRPHLLMIQELKTSQGLQDVTNMMNELNYGNFDHSTFVSQQSSPGNSNPLQQAIVFDKEKFGLTSEHVITTDVRDFNGYKLFIKDAELPNGADTTFLWVFVTHLKSSEGSDNEQARLEMIDTWLQWLNENVPSESNVILAGDFNLYDNSEPAYLSLMDVANPIHMIDPLEEFGNWSGSGFDHKEILTQSTRIDAIFNDGAGGGVDDRFDFITFSESLMDGGNSLHYITDSWQSLGNNGDCYNESITGCAGGSNPVPADVIQSIYYMSDHIPQVCELHFEGVISGTKNIAVNSPILFPRGNIFGREIQFSVPHQWTGNITAEIFSTDGKRIYCGVFTASDRNNFISPGNSIQSTGIYWLRISSEINSVCAPFFIGEP